MGKITIDADLLAKLRTLTQPMELCEPSGRVVGKFLPTLDPSEWDSVEPQISDEEIQRRLRAKGKTYSTAQVLAHLEKL